MAEGEESVLCKSRSERADNRPSDAPSRGGGTIATVGLVVSARPSPTGHWAWKLFHAAGRRLDLGHASSQSMSQAWHANYHGSTIKRSISRSHRRVVAPHRACWDAVAASCNGIPPEDDRLVEPAAAIPRVFDSRLSQLGRSNAHFRRGNIERIVPATDLQAFMLAVG